MNGAPSPPTRSFAAILSSNSNSVDLFDPGTISTYRREPALQMSKQTMMQLAQPFHNALVGRFAFSRPPMDVIRKFFLSVRL